MRKRYQLILGLTWQPKNALRVEVQEIVQKNITRLAIASDLPRLFDSLGPLRSIVVTVKIMVQQLIK